MPDTNSTFPQRAPLGAQGILRRTSHRLWEDCCVAWNTFWRIDGGQWAGAFAYYAFSGLFPLVILLVTITSTVIDRERAASEVIRYVESYAPLSNELRRQVFDAIAGVVSARAEAGVIASLMLVWVATQVFTTLISATNKAWSTDAPNWWRLPLRSLMLLAILASALLLGLAVPILARMANSWLFPLHHARHWLNSFGSFGLPLVVIFVSLSLFYKLAPLRRTRLAQVWIPALCATVLLRAGQSLFVIYLKDFATLNVVYGTFGGIMALLLWIYVSGCIFIFGACLCAAASKRRALLEGRRRGAGASGGVQRAVGREARQESKAA